MKMRDYQLEVAHQALSELNSHSRIVVVCPTGSGKTVIAVNGIIPHLSGRTAWITHRKELARQAGGGNKAFKVFMIQSEISGNFENLIIDEGHHVCASKYRQIIRQYPNAKVIALTATPYRLDGVGLGSCGFATIVYGPDAYQLTQQGVLCAIRVYVPASERIDAWSTDAAVDEISKATFKKGVVFCRSVAECKTLASKLNSQGIRSASIDGETDSDQRNALFTGFSRGVIKVMCNHTIFTEGVDIPSVDLVVLNRHTQSRCLWKQMVGRGTRTAKDKSECVVLDLAGNAITHGSIYDREIYSLHGSVESTQSRELRGEAFKQINDNYKHNQGEELKEWKPQPKPTQLIESLQRLKSTSPLHRLRTAS